MVTRPPSLRAIAAFEAIARHGSFRKAAGELNLTPSALSHSIKALERRLNQRLFERSTAGTTLTESGISLLTRVRVSLDLLNDALDAAPGRHNERLVISALPSIARKIILPNLPSLYSALGDIGIELHATVALQAVDGEVDVGLRYGPGDWPVVQKRLIATERSIVVASPSYWTRELPRAPQDLTGCNLIHDRESSWRLWYEQLRSGAPPPSSRYLMITDSALVVDAAVAGYGIALVRESLARREIETGQLIKLFDRGLPSSNSYWAVWNGASRKKSAIAAFTEWLAIQFAPKG